MSQSSRPEDVSLMEGKISPSLVEITDFEKQEQQMQHTDQRNDSNVSNDCTTLNSQNICIVMDDANNAVQSQKQRIDVSTTSWVLQLWNVFFCFLAWACATSISTLVIGVSNLVWDEIGGSKSLSSVPLGAFFFGSAFVNLVRCQHDKDPFSTYGYRTTYIATNLFCGLLGGSLLSSFAVLYRKPWLLVVSMFCIGITNGIGYYLRFISTELVHETKHKSHAVTLTVSGGIIAAFVGPEAATAARGIMTSDPKLDVLGCYFVAGILYVAFILCIIAIQFPQTQTPLAHPIAAVFNETKQSTQIQQIPEQSSEFLVDETSLSPNLSEPTSNNISANIPHLDKAVDDAVIISSEIKDDDNHVDLSISGSQQSLRKSSLFSLWCCLFIEETIRFVVPMLLSTFAWTIMLLPMSMLRIAMRDIGFTSTQSLRAMEFHFVGMFGTGFVTGSLLQKCGPATVCTVGTVVTFVSLVINVMVKSEPTQESYRLFVLGMFLVGVGWNFSFTATTVWLTKLYSVSSSPAVGLATTINSCTVTSRPNDPVKDFNKDMQSNQYHEPHSIVGCALSSFCDERDVERNATEISPPIPKSTAVSFSVVVQKNYTKHQVQSSNDFFMFILAGLWTFFAGSIYSSQYSVQDDNPNYVSGWRAINYTTSILLLFQCVFLTYFYYTTTKKQI